MELVSPTDFIFCVRELLSKDFCRTIIENYQQDPRKHPGYTVGSRGEKKSQDVVKVSTDLDINNEDDWAPVYEQLHGAVSHAVLSIAALFPSLQVWPLRC